MALSKEDKKDVKQFFGKKAANAVSLATKDNALKKKFARGKKDMKEGRFVKLLPTSSAKGNNHENVTGFSAYPRGDKLNTTPRKWARPEDELSKEGKKHGYRM